MSIIPFNPATILEIKIGDLSAPVAVGVELSKLYLSADEIVRRLIKDISSDAETGKTIIPFDLLPWYKEQRMLLSEIHKLTGEVEDKVNMKKLEIQGELFKQLIKNLPADQRVILVKALKKNASK
jgi:hypothetical protein